MWRQLLLALVSLVSTSLPLFSKIGANLEYEYALLAAWGALILVPLVGALIPARWIPVEEGRYSPHIASQILWTTIAGPALALLPPAALIASGVCPCSLSGFVFWMVYLWYPAWILAHALMQGVLRLRTLGLSRSLAVYGVLLMDILLSLWTFWILWQSPQKRYLGFFAGFLHGPIYDDWIAMDHGLVLARAGHLALGLALLLLTWWRWRAITLSLAVLTLIGIGITCGLTAETYPSVKNSKIALDAQLPYVIKGQGFTLHAVRPADGDHGSRLALLRLARDAEFHILELSPVIGQGRPLPHVEIYVYPSEDDKKLWFGGGSTDVADVRTPSIHITQGSWPHPTLRHELVHALASGNGFYGLGFHPNLAFTEGLAVALAPEARTLTLDDGAASLIESKRLPAVEKLFSPAFWQVSGSRAYTVAGSFLRYLIQNKGQDAVTRLYAGASWKEALGASRDSLVQGWKDQILKNYDKGQNALYAEALYRDPGLFDDLCPHSKADLERGRSDGVYVRLRQPFNWDPVNQYAPWLTQLDPGRQEYRVRLWRRDVKSMGENRFPAKEDLTRWRDILKGALTLPAKTIEDVEIGLLLSDVLRLSDQRADSLQILQQLKDDAAQKYVGDALTREVHARIHVETMDDSRAMEWRRLLAGYTRTLPDPAKDAVPPPWLVTYLRFRNASAESHTKESLGLRLRDLSPDPNLPSTFAFEWYRLLAERAMRAEAYDLAAEAYSKAAAVARPGARDLTEENGRRALFYGTKGPLETKQAT